MLSLNERIKQSLSEPTPEPTQNKVTYNTKVKPKSIFRNFSTCPRCKQPLVKALAFNDADSEFWLECSNRKCNTYVNTYIPQEHQVAFHKDPHTICGNFGGFGSGKTTNSRMELYKHIFITPNGNSLVGANVASQYEQTLKRELEGDVPKALVRGFSNQKQYMDFHNGHRLLYRPFDDEGKLRSYNLTMYVIIEASEVKESVFTQLKTRLRNTAGGRQDRDENGELLFKASKTGVPIPVLSHDWRKGIIESNPSSGWIRSSVLMVADDVQKHGHVEDIIGILDKDKDPSISAHITATDANEFLPPTFIAEITKNKPAYWIQRYVFGSFLYAEGLVYPSAMRYVVPTFAIPKNWKRLVAFDYGLADNAVYLFGAVDETNNLLYFYKEVVTSDKNVEELANLFHEASIDVPVGGWASPPIIDPKSGPKRDYDKKSLADHFLDYGISFIPGQINIDARIFKVNTYLECGKIRVMACCETLVEELREYKYAIQKGQDTGRSNKPEDKNNHCINPLTLSGLAA